VRRTSTDLVSVGLSLVG